MSILKFLLGKVKGFKEKEDRGEQYFWQALQLHEKGNYKEAIKYFNSSLDASPNHAAVYLNRGACFMVQERYLEAFDDFSKVIDLEKSGKSLDDAHITPMAKENIRRIWPILFIEMEQGDSIRKVFIEDGIDHFCKRWSEVIFSKFLKSDSSITIQFVNEELKELEELGGMHREYALNCRVDNSVFANTQPKEDTHSAFITFKGMLCCFSRTPDLMFEIRKNILERLIDISKYTNTSGYDINFSGRMHLKDAEVDIMFIVKNKRVIYINNKADSLFNIDDDGDLKLDGRVVNFKFSAIDDKIEVFVAFDDADSYSMFTMGVGIDDRLNYVAKEIFMFMIKNKITTVFSFTENYSSQYQYAFKLYKRNKVSYMINNSKTQAYLIKDGYFRDDDVSCIIDEFNSIDK